MEDVFLPEISKYDGYGTINDANLLDRGAERVGQRGQMQAAIFGPDISQNKSYYDFEV
jgi:hypothetical protein